MRQYEYYLLPEAGYTGEDVKKEGHYLVKTGTVADMLHESGLLNLSDFDRIIPNIEELNRILEQGIFARLVEWEPFTIDPKEYDEMVQQMLAIPMDRPYRWGLL